MRHLQLALLQNIGHAVLYYMEFHEKLSVENFLRKFHEIPRKIFHEFRGRFFMEFHVGKNMKTPRILYGIPCGILHGIIMEHDGSSWRFRMLLPTWSHHGKCHVPW